MVDTVKVEPLNKAVLEEIGCTWHTDEDGTDYISDELVVVSETEAEAYYQAANELYDMYVEAAQRVIDESLYESLSIPPALIPLIEESWDRDDWHVYGRFDLAGGIDGLPIKLIEFNADTPTSLFETAVVQWAILKANGMEESAQFNNVHQMLKDNFQRLIVGEGSLEEFSDRYKGQPILFSSVSGLDEDERTTRYLQEIAHEAGFYSGYCYLDEVGFVENEGIYNGDGQRADFWFKLFPWEDIANDEAELTEILASISQDGATRFINPAYTLLFQSKGLLSLLHEMYPDSPYLLEASHAPLVNQKQVQKRMFGREGANTVITDASGAELARVDGPYEQYPSVYQAYADMAQDANGQYYQAGVFFAWEACGLGFRRGSAILDNMSKFVGHVIKK